MQVKPQTQGDNTTQKFESKALGGEEKIKTLQKSLNVMLLSSCHATHITASKFKNTINSSLSLVTYISIHVSLLNDFDVYFVI